jgi:SAM-dependent methyltransferase
MERIVYDRMAELDSRHWWYRARRDILERLIETRVKPPADSRILEIGCGTGHNLAMLGRFGTVDAVEMDDAARTVASERLGRPAVKSTLPALEGVERGAYELIALLDVLEHVDEDRASLASIAERLQPDGRILVTVPAHPWMWSAHDVVNHHKRRYTKRGLRETIEQAGLKIELLSYFNSLLFPVAAAARVAGRLTGKDDSDDRLPPAPLNKTFEFLFRLERYAVGRVPFPPGVSLVAIASPAGSGASASAS